MSNEKIYKFKGMKHSVHMKLLSMDENGNCKLENVQYKGLFYKAKRKDLEEVR